MKKTQKQAKEVTVIAVYKFKQPLNRICFETLSSDNETHYHTCFDGSAEKSSCTCPGGQSVRRHCYHQDGLRARAAEYFAARQPQPEPELTAEDIADLVDPDIDATYKPAKVNPVQEAQQFINRVKAEKMALHNSNEHTFESAPSGRLVPMR